MKKLTRDERCEISALHKAGKTGSFPFLGVVEVNHHKGYRSLQKPKVPVNMSQISLPLDIDSLKILSQTVDAKGNIIIEVQSKIESGIVV